LKVYILEHRSRFQLVFDRGSCVSFHPVSVTLQESLSKTDEEKIEKIIRRELKGKEFEERVLKLTKGVLTQLYKLFYTRRAFWRDSLNTSSD
jgi:hypothetical protein